MCPLLYMYLINVGRICLSIQNDELQPEYIASTLYGVHLKFMVIRVDIVIGSTLDRWTCKRKSATVVYMETSEMRNN
jgi:hypothetical protein